MARTTVAAMRAGGEAMHAPTTARPVLAPLGGIASPAPRVCALVALAAVAGCVRAPASSFETIGVPEPTPVEGRAAVILGWAREDREGWAIRSVLVDGRRVRGWEPETQVPVVMYVAPGRREIAVSVRPAGGGEGGARPFRTRAEEVEVGAGDVLLCVARIVGRGPRRPVLRCMARVATGAASAPPVEDAASEAPPEAPPEVPREAPPEPPREETAPREGASPLQELYGRLDGSSPLSDLVSSPYTPPPGVRPPAAQGPAAPPAPGAPAGECLSLEALDQRLRRLERLVEALLRDRALPPAEPSRTATEGDAIDTSPPW